MFDVLLILFFCCSALYVGQSCVFIFVLRRPLQKKDRYEPHVSIIISARNEEQNLPECLNSLANLDYPKDKLEIIIIDHDSQDGTYRILNDFAQKNKQFKIF